MCNPRDRKPLLRPSANYSKLLERVAYRTMSNIPDEIFCKNSHQPRDVDYFRKNVPPKMYNWILNALPIEKVLQIWGVAKL